MPRAILPWWDGREARNILTGEELTRCRRWQLIKDATCPLRRRADSRAVPSCMCYTYRKRSVVSRQRSAGEGNAKGCMGALLQRC
jgi:hypothetical protein